MSVFLITLATLSAATSGWNFWLAFHTDNGFAGINFVMGFVALALVFINLMHLWMLRTLR